MKKINKAQQITRLAEAASVTSATKDFKNSLGPDNIQKEDGDSRLDFGKFSIWLRADNRGDLESINGTLPKNKEGLYKELLKKHKVESDVIFRAQEHESEY